MGGVLCKDEVIYREAWKRKWGGGRRKENMKMESKNSRLSIGKGMDTLRRGKT